MDAPLPHRRGRRMLLRVVAIGAAASFAGCSSTNVVGDIAITPDGGDSGRDATPADVHVDPCDVDSDFVGDSVCAPDTGGTIMNPPDGSPDVFIGTVAMDAGSDTSPDVVVGTIVMPTDGGDADSH